MANPYLIAGGCFGLSGVALGALGAHGLDHLLNESTGATWQTAVLYHLVHAVALLAIGLYLAVNRRQRKRALSRRDLAEDPDGQKQALARAQVLRARGLKIAGLGFSLGVLLFSGSLYLLALNGPAVLGPLTPVGGLCFLLGWVAVIYAGSVQADA